jgi:NADPH-dependent 2,4-dienoyl-CoA reductase/sulfur reductase-like enzyme
VTTGVDLAIVGAGPAGLAAAKTATELGLATMVFDEQGSPGGQIYRNIETVAASRSTDLDLLGPDYSRGQDLVRQFHASAAIYRPRMTVWQVDEDRRLYASGAHGTEVVEAKRILIATGAMERPVPIPGWTLPGVMTCGALVPEGRVVIAGSGPLLVLLTWQLARAGVNITAVLETAPISNYLRASPHVLAAASAPGDLGKGLKMLRDFRRAGIPLRHRVSGLRAHGIERVGEIEYRWRGRTHRQPVESLLLHEGVVPNANLALSIRCDHQWDQRQRCFRPEVDAWGNLSTGNVLVAGDCRGIGGAVVAEYRGRLAAIAAAQQLGRIEEGERDSRAAPLRRQVRRHLKSRPFLDVLYRPRRESLAPPDPETIICRCEEVTAGEVRRLVAQGCLGPNQMKAFVRCGMGPCQGRMCGLPVVETIAETRGVPVSEVGYYRIRPPVKPVTIGELAALEEIQPS